MTPETNESLDVVQAFLQFASLGSAWVMWVMIVLGLVLTVLVLERLRLYASTSVDVPSLGRSLMEHLDHGEVSKAQTLVRRGLAMEERVLSDGLQAWKRGPVAAEQIMKSSLERERQRFDLFLSFMGTVGSNTPFIGLLGTVIGIVVSFQDLAANPKGGMAVVGPGIAEALVSTAVGLLVAIPAVIAFNQFKSTLSKRIGNVEFLSGILLSQLNAEKR